jgi:DNA-binding transcriptional MocR family regulator
MMTRKPYKQEKRGVGRHVQLPEWLQASEAWGSLKPGPVALYVALKRRFNGYNNGEIFLSHRDAAKALNVGRDTVAGYFRELIEKGFIVQTRGHCLGPSGIGLAARYALSETPIGSTPATKEFMRWKKQNPSRKSRHSLTGKSSTPCGKTRHSQNQTLENPAIRNANPTLDNPAISTCDHVVSFPIAKAESVER